MKKLSLRKFNTKFVHIYFLNIWIVCNKICNRGKNEISVSLIVFASFLDNIDGKLARLFKTNSDFGVELILCQTL